MTQSTLSRVRVATGLSALLVCLLTAAMAIAAPSPRPPRARAPAPSASKASKPARTVPKATPVSGVLNLNEATEAQLRTLPGVGAKKALRIVAWREKHGPFKRVKDLRRVKGFGKKTVDKLEPFLRLSGPTTLKKAS